MLKYNNKQCNTFVRAMERNGRKVTHYRGRNFWSGPSVVVPFDDFQTVCRETRVRLQYDSMGKHSIIVYPVANGGDPIEK